MTVIFRNIRVAYTPVPKNACTTLKMALHHQEHGADDTPKNIHKVYGSRMNGGRHRWWLLNYFKFGVVRDPIDRFVSGYNNRILHHWDVGKVIKNDQGIDLPKVPTIEEFIEDFDAYFEQIQAVGHHFAPQFAFLSNVHTKIKLYRLSEMESLRGHLSEHLKKEIIFERLQTGKGKGPKKAKRSDIKPEHLRKLERFYEDDFKFLGPF